MKDCVLSRPANTPSAKKELKMHYYQNTKPIETTHAVKTQERWNKMKLNPSGTTEKEDKTLNEIWDQVEMSVINTGQLQEGQCLKFMNVRYETLLSKPVNGIKVCG